VLERNELLKIFSELAIVLYSEDGLGSNPTQGLRNEALLIAQKR